MPSTLPKLLVYSAVSAFPNASRLRLFLLEKGVEGLFEQRLVDVLGGEHRCWPHVQRNPWGEVPVLELPDGSHLSEAAAIARYVDQQWTGTRAVMGTTPLLQALDVQWEEASASTSSCPCSPWPMCPTASAVLSWS